MRAILHRALLAAVLAGLCAGAGADYPAKPIRLIVPFPAGGAADASARIVGESLSRSLAQTVIVENRAGGDGVIAADAVIKSAPDGYTLLFGTVTGMVGVPLLRKTPPYDPLEAFSPISLIGRFGFFLFTHPEVPARTLAELVDYARANPGKLNYGTGNLTSIVLTGQLMKLAGISMVHVPYKGDAPAITDLVGGRIQLAFMTTAAALGQVKDGRLRVLATVLETRSPVAPEVPTMVEAGLRGVTITPWAALFGPAGMPREIVERLSRETNAGLARQEVRDQLGRQLFQGEGSTPEGLAQYLKQQREDWRQAISDAGILSE